MRSSCHVFQVIDSINEEFTYQSSLDLGDDTFETSGAQLVILEAIRGPQDVVGRGYRLEMTVQRFESTQTISASAEITIVDET